ncbi:MAG: hypothetical protein IPJ30_25645 [Acidobacteria bacterium]|nr:hypothetical protein [Acidobacteriota bacterium]
MLNVSELPPVFRPSMVTLSAPLRSTSAPTNEPETVRAPPPDRLIATDEYEAEPVPLALDRRRLRSCCRRC